MGDERAELPVAPAATSCKHREGNRRAPLLIDRLHRTFGPAGVAEQRRERLAITIRIVPEAVRRVEIHRLERAHERPSQAEAVPNDSVDGTGISDAFLHER